MKWFKFYGQDYLSDPKMLSLSACERSCWITLLSYSSINDNGVITFLSEEQLMIQAGIPFGEDEWDRAKGIVEKLKKLEMIDVDNEMITIKNWKKRQETSLTSYERVKRFRQKKRDDNAKITLEENRIEEKRINTSDKSQKKQFNALGSEILKAFEEVDPKNKTYYGNKTQRSACDFLLEEYGLEKVLKAIKILPQINSKKLYIKQITTPYDLKENWVKIGNAIRQEATLLTSKGKGIA